MSQVYGQHIEAGKTTTFKPIKAVPLPDGGYALAVDTELTLDAANLSIANIKVGSTDQSTSTLRYLKTLDDGTLVVSTEGGDPLAGYKTARTQDSGPYPRYFGLVDKDENWVIIEETLSGTEKTYLFFAGSGNFTTAWAGKASHTYDEFFNIF